MKFIASLLTALVLTAPAVANDYIVVLFDNSGSMADYMRTAKCSRMECAQKALIATLTNVPDSTHIGVMTFNGWIYDLQQVDKEKLAEAIRGCRPGGGTPLYEYMKQAANRLLDERQKQGNVGYYKLLVVTDGEAQDDRLNQDSKFGDGSYKPGVLADIISRGITVDAIGLEMRNDHALKNLINGQYMRGDDPNSIQQSLKKSVAEVGFNGRDDVSEEAFKTVGELPEQFVKDALQGLTTFRNHPIGEKPPILMVKGGVVVQVPDPGNAKADDSGGLGVGGWILIVVGIIVVLVVIGVIASNSSSRR